MPAHRLAPWWLWSLLLWLIVSAPELALSQEDRLAKARRDLEVGVATEQRIRNDLNRYRTSGEASPDRIALYETYLDRVRQLTQEKRNRVRQLEKNLRAPPATAGRNAAAPATPPPRLDIPEDRELDELRALQRALDRSIAAFDDMLLTESELARVQSELKMRQLAQEAAQAARSLRASGGAGGEGGEDGKTGTTEGQSSAGDGDQTGETAPQGDREGLEGDAGEAVQNGTQAETGGGRYREKGTTASDPGQGTQPSPGGADQPPEAQDDDIVARQLREAAEKETDPALKEKLWEEYYEYKKGL